MTNIDLQTKTILLVEDNPDAVELTRIALKKEAIDCNLVVMRDGAEALDYFTSASSSTNVIPDFILLDLKLPKISGLEVLKQLRDNRKTKTIPIVVLTSSDEETDINESYKSGVNSYIIKSDNFEKFCETIRVLSSYWLKLNKSAL